MRLEGQELLNKLEELGESAAKDQQMLSTGYYTIRKDGSKRLAQSDFYLALMEARSTQGNSARDSTNPTEKYSQDSSSSNADEQAELPSETSVVRVSGLGIMICLYEISKEDFDKFRQLSEEGDLDYDDLEVGTDHGDQVAAYFEPSIMVAGEELNESGSLAELGATINCSEERIAPRGSHWSLSIETYKGIWGAVNAPREKAKDLSNYVVHKTKVIIGEDPGFAPLEIATVSFMDDEYGELNEHELEGKSIDWYLVDMSGEVYSV